MSDAKKKLVDLLDYIDHMVKLGEKPVFNLNNYKQLKYNEIDLKNRIGITHNLSSDDEQIWLKIERLQRNDPPPVPEHLTQWISVSRDPFTFPKVKSIITKKTRYVAPSPMLVQKIFVTIDFAKITRDSNITSNSRSLPTRIFKEVKKVTQ